MYRMQVIEPQCHRDFISLLPREAHTYDMASEPGETFTPCRGLDRASRFVPGYIIYGQNVHLLVRFSRFCNWKKGRVLSKPTAKHPVKLHVWAGSSTDGAGPLLVFDSIMATKYYKEKIVDKTLVPWLELAYPDEFGGVALIQDNDPKHTTADKYLEEKWIRWRHTPKGSRLEYYRNGLGPYEMVATGPQETNKPPNIGGGNT